MQKLPVDGSPSGGTAHTDYTSFSRVYCLYLQSCLRAECAHYFYLFSNCRPPPLPPAVGCKWCCLVNQTLEKPWVAPPTRISDNFTAPPAFPSWGMLQGLARGKGP